MKKALAEKIVQATEYDMDSELRENYTGRGGGGVSTTGVVFEGSVGRILSMIIENANLFVREDGTSLFESVMLSTDNMGKHSTIIY